MENQEQNQTNPAALQPQNIGTPISQPTQSESQPVSPQTIQPTAPGPAPQPGQTLPSTQPISNQPMDGLVDQPVSYSEAKKSGGKGLLIVIIVVIVLLLAAAGAAWYFYFSKPTAQELYQAAFANSMTTTNEKKYADLNISSDHVTLKGGSIIDTSGNSDDVSVNMSVDMVKNGIPLDMNSDVVSIKNNTAVDNYTRLNSFSSADWAATNALDRIFAKTKGKWIESSSAVTKSNQASADFQADGPVAAVEALDIVAPFATVSANDKTTYINAAKSDNLFTIKKGVNDTQFRGQSARLVNVSVDKSGLEKFNNDMADELSSQAKYEKLSQSYIDALFGDQASLPIKIYIAPNSPQIVGVAFTVSFAKAVTEKIFGTKMTNIDVSVLISDLGNHKITAPDHYIKG